MRIGLDLQSVRGPVSGIGAYAQGLATALPPAMAAAGGNHTLVPLWCRGFRRWPAPAEIAREQLALAAAGWRRRLDVIHAPGFAPPLWGRARRILTLHDLSVWQRPELLPAGISRCYWRDWVSFAARHSDCLVAPSHFTAEVARACLGVAPRRIRHVPYPARAEFRPAPPGEQAALRQHFGLERPYILGLGAREPRKQWSAVVRAFALAAPGCEHDLVLAGGVNVASSAAEIERAVAASGVGGRIRQLGYVGDAWLPALYSAAAVMVFPETYAGYGLPLLEAMACGTPVVSFANTALPETAGGAAELIPPPYAPSDIAAALRSLLHHPARAAELRRRGFERAASFKWSTTAQALIAIYEEFGA